MVQRDDFGRFHENQSFPKEYADRVKNEVSDRHLLMQAGNAMTVNVIQMLGN